MCSIQISLNLKQHDTGVQQDLTEPLTHTSPTLDRVINQPLINTYVTNTLDIRCQKLWVMYHQRVAKYTFLHKISSFLKQSLGSIFSLIFDFIRNGSVVQIRFLTDMLIPVDVTSPSWRRLQLQPVLSLHQLEKRRTNISTILTYFCIHISS